MLQPRNYWPRSGQFGRTVVIDKTPAHLRLTLVRHAKSSWQNSALDDFDRPLNQRGLADLVMMPPIIVQSTPRPDLIYCSAAARAQHTARVLSHSYGLDAQQLLIDEKLYLASATHILEFLANNTYAVGHVFVVAHNPGLTDLYNYLLCDAQQAVDNLPTFAVADLALNATSWQQVGAGCAQVHRLSFPKEFRKNE